MEIIVGSLTVAFLIALWIQRLTVRQITNEFLKGMKDKDEQSARERESLHKLIKATDLTEFVATTPIPRKEPEPPSPEDLKWNYEFDRVGQYDTEDLNGTAKY